MELSVTCGVESDAEEQADSDDSSDGASSASSASAQSASESESETERKRSPESPIEAERALRAILNNLRSRVVHLVRLNDSKFEKHARNVALAGSAFGVRLDEFAEL